MNSLLDVAVRRAGEGGFDKPVAALAGGAVAALAMLMPIDVLQSLVNDSGLPSLIAAAEPPLGMKAKLLIAVVAALATSGAVYGVMRLLGGKPARPVRWGSEESDVQLERAPRMRRRDLHPDAPMPAPISALRDLGDPIEDLPVEAPIDHPEPLAEPVAKEFVVPEAEVVEEPVPVPVAEPVERREAPQGEETIAELLARLERALEKKPVPQWLERPEAPAPEPQQRLQEQPQPGPAPANEEAAEPMDARLRSALENLKRFAPAHG